MHQTNENHHTQHYQNNWRNGNQLTVSGTEVGEGITVYDMAGMIVGSAKATSQATTISTTLQKGETVIVKVGEKSMKVVVKK